MISIFKWKIFAIYSMNSVYFTYSKQPAYKVDNCSKHVLCLYAEKLKLFKTYSEIQNKSFHLFPFKATYPKPVMPLWPSGGFSARSKHNVLEQNARRSW